MGPQAVEDLQAIRDFIGRDPPRYAAAVVEQIAPGLVLGHYHEKQPNTFVLCGDPLASCGTWAEASCRVTVTTYAPITRDAGVSTIYAIHDSTCP